MSAGDSEVSGEFAESQAAGLFSSRLAWSLLLVSGCIGFLLNPESSLSKGEISEGFRATAAGLGALLVIGRAVIPQRAHRNRMIASVLVLAWAGALIGGLAGSQVDRAFSRYESRLWSSYHYYLGAKYFSELGYDGLYDQTAAVDAEHNRRFSGLHSLRDLKTYQKEPMNLSERVRSDQWTDERWVAFSSDVLWFQGLKEGRDGVADRADRWRIKERSWKRMLRDRGYNATPTSNTIYWLVSRVPLSERNLMWVGLLDPLLLLLVFITAAFVFGIVRSATSLAWLLLFFGNEFHIVGGPLLHDYLAALVLMACAIHSNRPMAAGLALGYAAMTRVFPVFFLLGFGVWAFVRWRKARKIPRFVDRFLRGLVTSCVVLFLLGCMNTRGVKAWGEWADNISLHSEDHRFGNKRIGLQHIFTHDFGLEQGRWGKKEWRRSTWPEQKKYWVASAGLLLLLWGLGTWRRSGVELNPLSSIVFSLMVVFALIVISRYYWSAACLFFLLGGRDRDGPWEGALAGGLLLVVAVFYLLSPGIETNFGQYHRANVLLVLWALPLLCWRALRARR